MTNPFVHIELQTRDPAASTNKARELGATVLQDVMQAGDYGWLSVIMDPTGAASPCGSLKRVHKAPQVGAGQGKGVVRQMAVVSHG